jgi:hypothetical protein
MRTIKELASFLLESGKIGPSPESIFRGIPDVQPEENLPSDFAEFIRLCGGKQLSWGLNFFLYPGLLLKNVNGKFSNPSYPFTFPEYDSAYLFASSAEHGACLGVDLSSDKFGWIFSYFWEDPMVSTDSNFLFRSTTEFLEWLVDRGDEFKEAICPVVETNDGKCP